MTDTAHQKCLTDFLFSRKLWNYSFLYWWIISLATILMFDLFWMGQTTFRPMSYFAFYPILFLSAFFLTLPTLLFRHGLVQTLWLLFFDFLFIANLMYCRTYYNAIPLQSYRLVGNLADFHASVFDSFKWYFIFLPLLSLLAFAFFTLCKRIPRRLTPPIPYLLYMIILVIITGVSDAWRGGWMKRMDFMSEYAYLSSSITPIYSLAGFLIHDYYKTSAALTPQEKLSVEEWLQTHKEFTDPYWNNTTRNTIKTPKNLVLVLCESFESWPIGKTIEGKELTPFINSLIADSSSFYAPNVVTQVGSGRSIEGQLLTLTGLMPMRNKVYAYDAVDNFFFSLPKAMKARGAKTYLLTPDKPYVWNQARVAPAFGFDTLIHSSDFIIDETTGRTKRLSDGSLMEQIVGKIKSGEVWKEGEDVMLMTVTNSGHNPFDLPGHLRTISFEGNYPKIIKDYMVTAHYTDASLSTLVDYLKSRTDWEETMVVITGDHEGLASDRRLAMENKETKTFVDSLRHTPLIILNSPIPGRYEKQLGQVDVYSTLLDLMGFDSYEWKGLGYSIFSPEAPTVAIGSSGEIVGDTTALDQSKLRHLKKARTISDIILKFNLLKNYPDSISPN